MKVETLLRDKEALIGEKGFFFLFRKHKRKPSAVTFAASVKLEKEDSAHVSGEDAGWKSQPPCVSTAKPSGHIQTIIA